MFLRIPTQTLSDMMRNIPINHTLFRSAILGFMIISVAGCQKSDIQACVDAQVESDRANPKNSDGTWSQFWQNGRFDEKESRSANYVFCGHVLKES